MRAKLRIEERDNEEGLVELAIYYNGEPINDKDFLESLKLLVISEVDIIRMTRLGKQSASKQLELPFDKAPGVQKPGE